MPSGRVLVLGGAAVVAVLILALGGWLWYGASQSRGLAAYADALARAETGQAADAEPAAREQAIRALDAVLAEYPSSAAATDAAYRLGSLRYARREYPAARGAWEVVLAKGASGTLRVLALSGIGYTWEAERSFSKAAQAFRAAADGVKPSDFLYEDVHLGLARNQELSGETAAAIATYKEVLEAAPRPRQSDMIRARLAALGG